MTLIKQFYPLPLVHHAPFALASSSKRFFSALASLSLTFFSALACCASSLAFRLANSFPL